MKNIEIKAVRLFEQLSQVEFAKILGVSASTISLVEIEERRVTDRLSIAVRKHFPIDDETYIEKVKKATRLF